MRGIFFLNSNHQAFSKPTTERRPIKTSLRQSAMLRHQGVAPYPTLGLFSAEGCDETRAKNGRQKSERAEANGARACNRSKKTIPEHQKHRITALKAHTHKRSRSLPACGPRLERRCQEVGVVAVVPTKHATDSTAGEKKRAGIRYSSGKQLLSSPLPPQDPVSPRQQSCAPLTRM